MAVIAKARLETGSPRFLRRRVNGSVSLIFRARSSELAQVSIVVQAKLMSVSVAKAATAKIRTSAQSKARSYLWHCAGEVSNAVLAAVGCKFRDWSETRISRRCLIDRMPRLTNALSGFNRCPHSTSMGRDSMEACNGRVTPAET